MDEIIKIINQAYGKDGYKVEREIEIPILKRKIKTTIFINATSPTKFVFTAAKDGGCIKFEPGVKIRVPMLFGMEATLVQIDFDSVVAHISCAGTPTITVPLTKV